ncbi:MAG TPA: hypothetical protein EYP52_10775 [Anaerolineae bacterium]|nr:hypothetical protein [Anaerolineae bacterium]
MNVWVKDKRTPFVQEWRPFDQWRWQKETFRNLGENGKVFVSLDVVIPNKDSLPFLVGSVAHLDYSTVLRGMSTGVMPFLPAGGKGVDVPATVFSSVGEGFERYLCFIYAQYIRHVPGLIRVATYRELREAGERALGPEELYLFHPRQYAQENFPFVPLQEDTLLSWIRGTDLLTGDVVWAPAQIIVMGYAAHGEPPVGFSSSAGLSAGSSIEEAIVHGFQEFVERDANNIHWVTRIPPLRVRLSRQDVERLTCISLPNLPTMRVDVFLWSEFVPEIAVVTAHVIREDMEWYAYWPGIGVAFDFATALRKALSESAQGQLFIPYMHKVKQAFGKHPTYYYVEEDEDPSRIDNLFKTIVYYGYRKNLERMYREYFDLSPEITLKGLEKRGFQLFPQRLSLTSQVKRVKEIAHKHGWHPVVFDLTPPEVQGSAALVRVVIPELTPYYTISLPAFGHPRYQNAPAILRGEERRLDLEDFCFEPMPFP